MAAVEDLQVAHFVELSHSSACCWDASWGLINPSWVTLARVYDVVRPETPIDPRIHH